MKTVTVLGKFQWGGMLYNSNETCIVSTYVCIYLHENVKNVFTTVVCLHCMLTTNFHPAIYKDCSL